MNLIDPTTATSATTKAVKPGIPTGTYNDPAQVGAMIQSMYPQYKSFDPATLGQRWISLHTPRPAAGTGTSNLVLSPGVGGTPMTSTTPGAPDISGLSKFRTLTQVPEQKPQLNNIKILPTAGMGQLTQGQGNQILSTAQDNTPGIGSQISSAWNNYWNVPKIQPIPLTNLAIK